MRSLTRLCLILTIVATTFQKSELWAQDFTLSKTPLLQAHAHNDYEHSKPLWDSLQQGFTSVEADIYLVDGELLVAHNRMDVSKDRTLEKLYLEPLQRIVQQGQGRVYPGGPSFNLLIDIKMNGAATYRVLEELLRKYQGILSTSTNGKTKEGAVTVIISGDRPIPEITASNPRFAGIDGRLTDLDSQVDASLMPWISDNWSKHFRYRGQGEWDEAEKKKLNEIVSKVHAQGRRLRFWGTPESERMWSELHLANVDLIGTDHLERLAQFLNGIRHRN